MPEMPPQPPTLPHQRRSPVPPVLAVILIALAALAPWALKNTAVVRSSISSPKGTPPSSTILLENPYAAPAHDSLNFQEDDAETNTTPADDLELRSATLPEPIEPPVIAGTSRRPSPSDFASQWSQLSEDLARRSGDEPRATSLRHPLDIERLKRAIRDRFALNGANDPAADIDQLRPLADAGDPDAIHALGLLMAYGDQEVVDPVAAAALFARAADLGISRASAELGRLYLSGIGVKSDPARAKQLFTAALDLGDPEGAFLLGMGNRLGLFGAPDASAGIDLLVTAAERGHIAAARALLAMETRRNQPTGVDRGRIRSWLEAAANSGDAEVLLDLAGIYNEAGLRDLERTTLEAAAETGSYYATMRLASLSLNPITNLASLDTVTALVREYADRAGPVQDLASLELARLLAAGARDETAALAYLKQAARSEDKATVALDQHASGIPLSNAIADAYALSEAEAYRHIANRSVSRKPGTQNRPVSVLKNPVPRYPVELRADGVTGTATVRFIVTKDGIPTDIEAVDSTHPAFAASAAEAIKEWRFSPALKDGTPVNTRLRITIPFVIRD